MRNSILRLRSLQNITQGLNTSRMATDLVPLEANLGRSEWCHRDMVETHGIYTSCQQPLSHTRKLRHDSWHALFLRLKRWSCCFHLKSHMGEATEPSSCSLEASHVEMGKPMESHFPKPDRKPWASTTSPSAPLGGLGLLKVSGCRTWRYCRIV